MPVFHFDLCDLPAEADSLRQEVERHLSVTPRIRWGGPGQMDILVTGTIVFSKKAARRMPSPGEVVGLVKALKS